MGEESDHVHIVALTDALQVGRSSLLACRFSTDGHRRGRAIAAATLLAPEAHARDAAPHLLLTRCAPQVPVEVLYLDRSGAGAGGASGGASDVDTYAFVPEECGPERRKPLVSLLYRPGHFDILYRTAEDA